MVVSTLLIRGLQTLAVSAPRGSERDNCIMVFVLQRTQVGNGINEKSPSYLPRRRRRMCEHRGWPSQEAEEA